MRKTVENQKITLRQTMIDEILVEDGRLSVFVQQLAENMLPK